MPIPPYPTIPNPRTWGASGPEPVLVPELRGDVTNAVTLFENPPMVAVTGITAQSIANTTETLVTMGGELTDPWGNHVGTNSGIYPSLPGWYLCESTVPTSYGTATGVNVAGIGAVQGGGSLSYFDGGKVAMEAGFSAQPTAAKLVRISTVSPPTDYYAASTYQSSGAAQNTQVTASKFPILHAHWVAALTGTTGLPVPPTATTWPAPPSYMTSAMLNSDVRDAIRFLTYPPIVEAQSGANQSIASQSSPPTTGTALTNLTNETIDNYSAFASSTFTAPVAGLYFMYGQVSFSEAGITTGQARGAGLTVTSSNYNSGTTITLWGSVEAPCTGSSTSQNLGHCAVVRRHIRLNAGDTVRLAAYSAESGAASRTAGNAGNSQCRFIAVWRAA